jgi:hypothetical protein
MKLRIHGDSIRLRLNRREVAEFASAGRLEQVCQYGPRAGDRLVYALEASRNAQHPAIRVAGQAITVILPQALALGWTSTDKVEISTTNPVAAGRSVTVLVEKEFRRLHGANNDPDLYPNPLELLADRSRSAN